MKQDHNNRYGSWGMVAGAAEGLGKSFAKALAQKGMNLILVDLKEDPQMDLATQLKSSYQVKVITLTLDLAAEDTIGTLMDAITKTGCRLLIYNAAFSQVQEFLKNDPGMLDRYIQVNMRTPMQLVHAFSSFHSHDPDQGKGILLMSSLAGSWGTQYLAPYGGTKAFNHIFAEALHHELKGKGFDVLACIAGPTSTPGYQASLPPGKEKAIAAMHPDKVVRTALRSLGRRPFVVPGLKNKWNYFLLMRIFPRSLSLRIMNRAVGKLYRRKST